MASGMVAPRIAVEEAKADTTAPMLIGRTVAMTNIAKRTRMVRS